MSGDGKRRGDFRSRTDGNASNIDAISVRAGIAAANTSTRAALDQELGDVAATHMGGRAEPIEAPYVGAEKPNFIDAVSNEE